MKSSANNHLHAGMGALPSRVWPRLLLLALALLAPSAWSAKDEVSEYDLKAALLIKITAFVTWPEEQKDANASAQSDVQVSTSEVAAGVVPATELDSSPPKGVENVCIGIVGDDPFGAGFDDLLAKAGSEHRRLSAKRVHSAEEAAGCQVLFITNSARNDAANIIATNSGAILTMADYPGFAESGGMVELSLDGSRIALVINRDAVRAAGLTVSSKLLSLAKVIGKDPAASP